MKASLIKFFLLLLLIGAVGKSARAQSINDLQPFSFKIKALLQTLDYLGEPIDIRDKEIINKAIEKNDTSLFLTVGNMLDKYCLFNIQINPESRVKVTTGPARPDLLQNGWRTFLVKVYNQAGITAELEALSPQAKRDYDGGEKYTGWLV